MSFLHPTSNEERFRVTALLLCGSPLFATLATLGVIVGATYLRSKGWHVPIRVNIVTLVSAAVAMIGSGAGGFYSQSLTHKRIGFTFLFAFFGLVQYGLWNIAAGMAMFLFYAIMSRITP